MNISKKPTIVFLGTSGHIAPVVIKELIKNYNILITLIYTVNEATYRPSRRVR